MALPVVGVVELIDSNLTGDRTDLIGELSASFVGDRSPCIVSSNDLIGEMMSLVFTVDALVISEAAEKSTNFRVRLAAILACVGDLYGFGEKLSRLIDDCCSGVVASFSGEFSGVRFGLFTVESSFCGDFTDELTGDFSIDLVSTNERCGELNEGKNWWFFDGEL